MEMAEAVDDQKFSCSSRGTQTPDFDVLDVRIASALNRIIENTPLQEKNVSLEEMKAHKKRSFSPRKTDLLPDLRGLPGHWSQ